MGGNLDDAESDETGSPQKWPRPKPPHHVTDMLYIVWWLVHRTEAAKRPVPMSQPMLRSGTGLSRRNVLDAMEPLKADWVDWESPWYPNGAVKSTVRVHLEHEVGGFRVIDWLKVFDSEFSMRAEGHERSRHPKP